MRTIAAAFGAVLLTIGVAGAQPAPNRSGALPASPTGAMHPDQFATESDAKTHCGSQTVVWLNTRSRVYHFAGTRDYGRTKEGAYMCQSDADKGGRAAKNEKPPGR